MKKQVTFIFIAMIVIAFAMISFLPSVRADFTIKEKITTNVVCPGSTILLQHTITADQSGPFTVAVSGTASRFSTTVPSGFWLGADQSKTLYTYITPSSKISPGVYEIKITLESNGVIKETKHDIIVENCHNVDLKIEPEEQKICACEEKTMALTISNKGEYLDNYHLSVEGPAAKWITLSSKTITLAPNSSVTVDAYINTPCEAKGSYELNFVAETRPYAKVNKKAKIEIVHCYDYSMGSDKTLYNLCEAEELSIPVKIKNLGTADNIYLINIDAPEWIKADQRELTITESGEKTFNLIAKPPYNTEGNFSVAIEVLSDFGDVMKKHSLELDVESCYDVSLSIEADKDKICNALTNTYSVIVKNTGKFPNSFMLSVDGPEWATLSDNYITLNASAETSIDLMVKPPFEAKANVNEIIIRAATDNASGIEASDTISLETISVEDCYKPAISTQDDNLTVGRESAATLPIIIENKGTNDANYSIEISGTASNFCQINPGAITIKAGEAQTIYLYIAPPFETKLDDYTMTITARLIDTTILASKVITISVIEAEEMPELPGENTNMTNATDADDAGIGDITGETVKEAEGPSVWSRFIAWLVNLFKPRETSEAVTDFNISTNLTDTETNETGNRAPVLKQEIQEIEIEKDGEYTIDLADYFEDPDNDSLTYVVIKPLHVNVASVGSKITLKPEKSFIGMTKVTFHAYDGKTVATSNKITIKVGMPADLPPETGGNETGNETQGNETAGNYTAGNGNGTEGNYTSNETGNQTE